MGARGRGRSPAVILRDFDWGFEVLQKGSVKEMGQRGAKTGSEGVIPRRRRTHRKGGRRNREL